MAAGSAYEQEFAEFMANSASSLQHTAWLLTGDEHASEELVQEALTRTFMHWRQARRDPLRYARKLLTSRRAAAAKGILRERVVAQVPDAAVPSSEAATLERDRLSRALSSLSPRQRQIVVLRYFEGLSEQEVAAELGVAVGTVKSTASRALTELREILEPS